MENLSEGVYFVNNDRIITYWNEGAERLSGYTPAQVVGRYCGDNILEHIDEAGRCVCGADCPLTGTIQDGEPREVELYMRHRLGYRIPVSIRSTAIRNSLGQIAGAIEVFTNISMKKKIERRIGELEDLAYHDSLTGVANRRYAELKLQQATQDVQLFGRRIGLILMDLDRFKEVNDTWGHATGDRVLLAVSKTLVGSLRPTDFVGRWGGEEFVVFVVDATAQLLRIIAERCRILIAATSIPLADRESIQVTASMGTTLLLPADTSQSAIARADKLMYESKTAGRNRITFGA